MTVPCPHLSELPDPATLPPADPGDGCPVCIAAGLTGWVHLRQCLTCGQVGCCDSSPQRHASGHHRVTGHPVLRSIEPGEDWRWCFVDKAMV